MLGLGGSIPQSSFVEKRIVGSFTSVFDGSGSDNSSEILAHSVDQGTLNFTTNSDIGTGS